MEAKDYDECVARSWAAKAKKQQLNNEKWMEMHQVFISAYHPTITIFQLPIPMLEIILSFLDAHSVILFSSTCKRAYELTAADSFWKHLFIQTFRVITHWKSFFGECFKWKHSMMKCKTKEGRVKRCSSCHEFQDLRISCKYCAMKYCSKCMSRCNMCSGSFCDVCIYVVFLCMCLAHSHSV